MMKPSIFPAIRLITLLFLTITSCAAKKPPIPPSPPLVSDGRRYDVVTVADHLDHPWSVAFLPDGSFLVTERSGHLLRIARDGKARQEIVGLPRIAVEDQGGLLDVLLDPGFRTNQIIYLSFSAAGAGGTGTEVMRARLDGTSLSDTTTIFRALPKTPVSKQYGSRFLMATDGKLLVTIGDKTDMQQAQNLGNHLGKVVRINPDGSIPHDNPFLGTPGAQPAIYCYGNRNIQGIAIHPVTGLIWMHEHGPMGGDELNILKKGANYGWPLVTYGIDYSGEVISDKATAPGIETPVLQWTPCIAPSGMAFCTGDRYPEWKGNLFIGSLVQRHLRRVVLDGDKVTGEQELFRDLKERIRDVRQGPDGYLYLLTDNDDGRLLRIVPTP